MASVARRAWLQAIDQVQGVSTDVSVPLWLSDADLEALDAAHLQVRLPASAREGEVPPALVSALERALERTMGRRVALEFRSPAASADAGPRAAEAAPPAAPATPRADAELAAASLAPGGPDVPREPHLNPLYTFEHFVTGPCNRLAHAAALAVSDLPGRAYNPLFIHASVGLGKSHLLQAICHKVVGLRPDVSMMYISCEDFVNRFITAIGRGQMEEFRHRFRHLDMLIIDDVHYLADKDRTQDEFFHTFNTLYQAQKQVVLSSDSPPHEIPSLEERLVSRFKWGLVVRIDRPSFETRVAIVQKKALLRGRELPEAVVNYIATLVETNNRELEGAVVRVLGYASLCNREIDLELAKEALRDLATSPRRTITIQSVADAVLARYSVRLSDLQGKRRSQSVALPRQIAMYLARRLTNRSLEEIGTFFGGRDHTTVLHAERKIEHRVGKDAGFRGLVEAIEREVLRS